MLTIKPLFVSFSSLSHNLRSFLSSMIWDQIVTFLFSFTNLLVFCALYFIFYLSWPSIKQILTTSFNKMTNGLMFLTVSGIQYKKHVWPEQMAFCCHPMILTYLPMCPRSCCQGDSYGQYYWPIQVLITDDLILYTAGFFFNEADCLQSPHNASVAEHHGKNTKSSGVYLGGNRTNQIETFSSQASPSIRAAVYGHSHYVAKQPLSAWCTTEQKTKIMMV